MKCVRVYFLEKRGAYYCDKSIMASPTTEFNEKELKLFKL